MELTIHAKKALISGEFDSCMITLESVDGDLSFPAMLDYMEQELGDVMEILKLLGFDGQQLLQGRTVDECKK